MTAWSVAEATGLYGFSVSVLAAGRRGINRERVLKVGGFFTDNPDLGIVYLRRAEGYSQREIAKEMNMGLGSVRTMIRERLTSMASLLDPSVVV